MVGRRGPNPPGPVGGVGAGNPPGLSAALAVDRIPRGLSAALALGIPRACRRCWPWAESPGPCRRGRRWTAQRRRAAALAGTANAVSVGLAASEGAPTRLLQAFPDV